jgi:hypothetical protein
VFYSQGKHQTPAFPKKYYHKNITTKQLDNREVSSKAGRQREGVSDAFYFQGKKHHTPAFPKKYYHKNITIKQLDERPVFFKARRQREGVSDAFCS